MSHLATPPPTPPVRRKSSVSDAVIGSSSNTVTSSISNTITTVAKDVPPSVTRPAPTPRRQLPTEIWTQIFTHVDNLFPLLTVSRAWYADVERLLYRSITFTSLAQRNAFAASKLCSGRHRALAVEMKWVSEETQGEPSSPASAAASAQPVAALVKELDFGFRPTLVGPPLTPTPTPTPTPESSSPSTPTSSPSTTATTTPNSIALAADQICLSASSSSSSLASISSSSTDNYAAWQNRSISPLLVLISNRLPNLTTLGLAGCQFDDSIFADAIERLTRLTNLDLAGSNIKAQGLRAVANCTNLASLDLSGIFRFKRINPQHLTRIVSSCTQLTQLTLHQCPDIYDATRERFPELNRRLNVTWSGYDWDAVSARDVDVA
ncbi:hypothetical protein DFJ77DRAFT_460157 [Powellomyces hirtus]|nr:hypothetical protein DFJ77DRAFT_460157 [Powellomyces hirtus]